MQPFLDLVVRRVLLTEETSVGEMFFVHNGDRGLALARACYSLEDRYREPSEPKVPGKTCIPCGRYRLTIHEPSPKYNGKPMPRLHDVQLPDGKQRFDGVLLHPGNFERDTLGCVLPGLSFAEDGSPDRMKVLESTKAFENIIMPQLRISHGEGKALFVTVELAPAELLIDKRRPVCV